MDNELNKNFISMRCNHSDMVHTILKNENNIITIGEIYTLKRNLIPGKVIFLTLGGDKGKAEVNWEPGFIGICKIIRGPYDPGYNRENKKQKNTYFKIDVKINCLFEKPFKRRDFIEYPDAYDATYIGPALTNDPTQAVSLLDKDKAIAILRAVIDRYPNLEDTLREIFGNEILNRAKDAVEIMLPISLKYGESKKEAIAQLKEEMDQSDEENSIKNSIDEDPTKNAVHGGKNVLYYGVPGSGKSYLIDQEIKLEAAETRTERIVFHPDYTYEDLVGQISPRLKKNSQGEDKLTYEFIPGPFTKILHRSYLNPKNKYYLVIEEINRGNAPAIFGDIFQLLDRNSDGSGKYVITNFDLGRAIFSDETHAIRLPSNLFIYATMNTSDQNVFTLDTAFQRRWCMKYVKNNVDGVSYANTQISNSPITWSGFANIINEEILNYDEELMSSEDKQLGAYFVKENELSNEGFSEKVLKYLWNDVFRMDHGRIFKSDFKSIGSLIENYSDEVRNGNDPLKCVMRASIYEKMLQKSKREDIDESEVSEIETFSEEK